MKGANSMPFVKISLKTGKSKDYKKAISDSIHDSLVNIFAIPKLDRFQVITEVTEENIIYPSSYMSIPHTSEIIYIHITAKKGRSSEMKKNLYESITSLIHQKTAHNIDDIMIIMVENEEENWSFGRGKAQLID